MNDERPLTAAARAMWFAHTDDPRFAGPVPADPYGDFEQALLAALRAEATRDEGLRAKVEREIAAVIECPHCDENDSRNEGRLVALRWVLDQLASSSEPVPSEPPNTPPHTPHGPADPLLAAAENVIDAYRYGTGKPTDATVRARGIAVEHLAAVVRDIEAEPVPSEDGL